MMLVQLTACVEIMVLKKWELFIKSLYFYEEFVSLCQCTKYCTL